MWLNYNIGLIKSTNVYVRCRKMAVPKIHVDTLILKENNFIK